MSPAVHARADRPDTGDRSRWRRIAARVGEEPRPVRFLASRVLWRTRLGRRLKLRIDFPDGFWIWFHPAALPATLWLDRSYARSDLELLRRVVERDGVVIDVGANVGVLTLAASKLVGPRGTVVAVEPHPLTFSYLAENVRANGADNVRLHRFALGDTAGRVRLTDRRSDDQNAITDDGAMAVDCARLDDLVDPGLQVSVLKTDTEGFEMHVLRGAARTLARTRCVIVECNPAGLARYGSSPPELLELLTGSGFVVHRLVAGELEPIGPDGIGGEPENLVGLRVPPTRP